MNPAITPLVVLQLLVGMALFGSATPLSKIIGGAFPVGRVFAGPVLMTFEHVGNAAEHD